MKAIVSFIDFGALYQYAKWVLFVLAILIIGSTLYYGSLYLIRKLKELYNGVMIDRMYRKMYEMIEKNKDA